MSVANIHIAADRVWLASDTLQFDGDGNPHSFASKFSTYPHLYSLSGFRGLAQLHHRLDKWMNGLGNVLDVEDAAARLSPRLLLWRAELVEEYPDHADRVRGQVWLAGWRPSTRSFGGWCFSSETDFAPVELAVPGTYINPPGGADPPAVIATPDVLVRLVEAQRKMSEANVAIGGADLGIGGEVIVVELTRSGYTMRKAFRFPDFAEIKERLRNV